MNIASVVSNLQRTATEGKEIIMKRMVTLFLLVLMALSIVSCDKREGDDGLPTFMEAIWIPRKISILFWSMPKRLTVTIVMSIVQLSPREGLKGCLSIAIQSQLET